MSKLEKEFNEIKFTHMRKDKNQFVDALATLAFMAKIDYGNKVQPISIEVRNYLAHCCLIKGEIDKNLCIMISNSLSNIESIPWGIQYRYENPAKVSYGQLPRYLKCYTRGRPMKNY